MRGAAILNPSVWAGPLETGLGRDQKICGIWMKRFGDKTLCNLRPVRVGGVDEIDSQLDRAPQNRDCLGMIGRFSPDAVAGQLHCAEAESVNGNVPTDYENAAPSGGPRIGSVRMLSRGTFSGRAHNIYTRSFSVSMVSSAKKFFGFIALVYVAAASLTLSLRIRDPLQGLQTGR